MKRGEISYLNPAPTRLAYDLQVDQKPPFYDTACILDWDFYGWMRDPDYTSMNV